MLTGKEFVSDYEENKKDIEKWFSIKCPEKYRRFAELLESNGEDPTWKRIVDLYRYDKRLIVNCFKYLSFLEEHLRAIVVRHENKENAYEKWQKETMWELEMELQKMYRSGFHFDNPDLEKDIDNVRELRNAVSHNRILLEEPLSEYIGSLIRMLPETYRDNCRRYIVNCSKGLVVSERWYPLEYLV